MSGVAEAHLGLHHYTAGSWTDGERHFGEISKERVLLLVKNN